MTLNDCKDTLSYLVDNVSSTNNVIHSTINAHPNPFNEIIYVAHQDASYYKIIDIYGRIIDENNIQNNTINTIKLISGFYQLMIWNNKNELIGIQKMIKQQQQ